LSAVRSCLFIAFPATLQHTEAVSSIRNPETRHAVVTGTHLTSTLYEYCWEKSRSVGLLIYSNVLYTWFIHKLETVALILNIHILKQEMPLLWGYLT
jgi:hypothetical protein